MAIKVEDFREAILALETTRGISKEQILSSLEDALTRGFKKQLGGDDAIVKVSIDFEKGIIEMYSIKNIVNEVEDDFLEISKEDAKDGEKRKEGIIVENQYYVPANVDELRKATALSIKTMLRQKFAEHEKNTLLETFKDKIGTMVTGKIERIDSKGASINIGKACVYLPRSQMIGDENFANGDNIRLFVNDVESSSKGARIVVSRACEGFLKTLFFEEIREIYDGTIEIKAIARAAGERSKVAVYSSNPEIDPAGSCIGQNGIRIQKIVSQLGNGNAKEKIDIIAYSDNPGLYIMEALKPAHVVGVVLNEGEKSATVVVKDDSLSSAIGRSGVNVRLAVKLTGYKIDIKVESDAINENLEFVSFEELQAEEYNRRTQLLSEARLSNLNLNKTKDVLPGLPEGYIAPQQRVYEDEINDFDETLQNVVEKEDIPSALEETKENITLEDSSKESADISKESSIKEEPHKEITITSTLSDLEKNLEDASNSKKNKTNKKSTNRNNKNKHDDDSNEQKEESKENIVNKENTTRMSIYSEEELREIEEEERANQNNDSYDDEEEIDYDEYDEYYDDDGK